MLALGLRGFGPKRLRHRQKRFTKGFKVVTLDFFGPGIRVFLACLGAFRV